MFKFDRSPHDFDRRNTTDPSKALKKYDGVIMARIALTSDAVLAGETDYCNVRALRGPTTLGSLR